MSLVPFRRSGPSAVGLLRFLLATSIVAPVALFTVAAWLNYTAALSDSERELQRAAQVVREHATKVFDTQAQVADRVAELLNGMTDAEIAANECALHDALLRTLGHVSAITGVSVVGTSGQILVTSTICPVPSINLGGRDFFTAMTSGYVGTYVTQLHKSSIRGRLFFGLVQSRRGPDGRLLDIIQTAVAPETFVEFYRTLVEASGLSRGEAITLLRADGQVILRYPMVPDATELSQGAEFFRAIAEHAQDGTYRAGTATGKLPLRLFAYQQVPGYPLYVTVSRSWGTIVEEWALTMGSHLIFGIPATLTLFLITLMALRRTRQKEEALALAGAEMRRRELAENALTQRQRLEAVGQMTGGVAHDFNNLLTVVLGSLEMIGKHAEDPSRVRRFMANATLAAERGVDVTQKLLAFSRRQMVHPETVDLNRRLEAFLPLLRHAATEAVPIELNLAPELAPVRIDPGQLEAAVLNLVANARDALPEGGSIVISAVNRTVGQSGCRDLPPGDYVQITVSDNGFGMAPETAAKAFEPFFTTKDVGKGTGLGLSQVYGFAKQSGGDVRIVSAPGQGTSVEILLPRAEKAVDTPVVSAPAPLSVDGDKVVLVVEDEPGVRELAVECLQELGYRTISVPDAKAAIDVLRSEDRIDVLFSDVVMPGGMNGHQLSTEARRLRPGLKVLLTSGYAPTLFGQDSREEVPLLTKPYDQRQLAVGLEAVLAES